MMGKADSDIFPTSKAGQQKISRTGQRLFLRGRVMRSASKLHHTNHCRKDGKERPLFVGGPVPRHEGNHRVSVIHEVREEPLPHGRFDSRQFRAKSRDRGASNRDFLHWRGF